MAGHLLTMGIWHVWGDYGQTRPARIGSAELVNGEDQAAAQTAKAHGFDFDFRLRNGFMPWAATFRSDKDDNQEFEFASYPIVRGWQKVGSA